MLKLVSALDINPYYVIEYANSFENNDFNSYAIWCLKVEGVDEYINYIVNHECNSWNSMFYLIDDSNPKYIIGFCSIDYNYRYNFDKGNIGYGIRPSERNKGYGKAILNLALKECEKLGLSSINISCHEDNIISKKVIESTNAKLEKIFVDHWNNKNGLKYKIKLNPKLKNKIDRKILIFKDYYIY